MNELKPKSKEKKDETQVFCTFMNIRGILNPAKLSDGRN